MVSRKSIRSRFETELKLRGGELQSSKMDILWWCLTVALFLLGLVGTLVPLLPGTTLIFAGAVVHRLAFGPAESIGWPAFSVLFVLLLLSFALDFLGGSLGARRFGATRAGALGGIAGGVVGLFFGLWGVIAGPLLGVLLGELAAGQKLPAAVRSGWGTLLGTVAAAAVKCGIGVAMILWFFLELAFR